MAKTVGASKHSKSDAVYVALLRGINVGGKNKVPMSELRRLFEEARCRDVQTYIQSGNVIFRAAGTDAARSPDAVSAAIFERRGVRAPIQLRSHAELRRIVTSNPYVAARADTKLLHVAFLSTRPAKAKVGSLDPERSPPDEFTVRGCEVYLHCPNGIARTKLTNDYFDSALGTTSTMRNWRTVLKLLELTSETASQKP
jgi:uncharacterized protein (DUF1697 family)